MDWRTPISYTKRWGKEIEFLDYRGRIGRYLELKEFMQESGCYGVSGS
jgi:hypothetical protein